MGNASSLQSKVPWIEAQAGAGRQLPSCSVACQAACWRAWTLVCQEAHPRAPPLHRAPCLPRAPASLRCRCDLPNRAREALRQGAGGGAGLKAETRAWQRMRLMKNNTAAAAGAVLFFNRPRRGAAHLRGMLRTGPARRVACPPWLSSVHCPRRCHTVSKLETWQLLVLSHATVHEPPTQTALGS